MRLYHEDEARFANAANGTLGVWDEQEHDHEQVEGVLDTLSGSDALRAELRSATPVLHDALARQGEDEALLARLLLAARLAGITRLADVSCLSAAGLHVVQASRPDIYSHPFFGQNSSSQGKGRDRTSACIAAILEAIEAYSAEPRNVSFIRGSAEFLSRTHAIIPPGAYARTAAVTPSTPLMWTDAYSISRETDVLVPAEAVFFPFFAADYETPSAFPCNSTGLGAGGSLLRAAIHGTYEVIERHFRALFVDGARSVIVERLRDETLDGLPMLDAVRARHPELQRCVLSLRLRGAVPGLFMVICILADPAGDAHCGYSCDTRPLAALDSAVIEAVQSAVTLWSGSREDGTIRMLASGARPERARLEFPPATLSLDEFAARPRPEHATLQQELAFLVDWTRGLGFPELLVKDLTRAGLGVPVVRVLCPGMRHPASFGVGPFTHGQAQVAACRFAMDL